MTIPIPHLRVPGGQDRRQADILDAVRDAFVEKGFDGASMQDLARAAGISVGNFYRYFESKNAIVEAIVARDLDEVGRDFAEIIRSAHPLNALRATIRRHVEGHACCDGDGLLWADITAAAGRKPEIATILDRMETNIGHYLTTVFGLVTKLPEAEAARRYGGHAALIVMLVKASGMRIPVPGAGQTDLNNLILRTIDRTLDEIATDAAKG